MKNIIHIFLALTIFACSSDDSIDTNNDIPNGQYFFEIEFAGETHRVEGISAEMLSNSSTNIISTQILSGDMLINFRLNDISATNYISGQPINITMKIENPQIGDNNGSITFAPTSYMQNYISENNISLDFSINYFVENRTDLNATDANTLGLLGKVSNISITDIGTPPSSPITLDGQNVSGSYQGTLYFRDNDDLESDFINSLFSVPVPLKISFSAPRWN